MEESYESSESDSANANGNANTNNSSSSNSSSWWGGVWSGAATFVTTAASNPSKALAQASERAAAAVTSINESYKISEGIASVSEAAKSVATIVEQRGTDLKNVTLQSVEKLMDAIDPIEADDSYLYKATDFEDAVFEAKLKVIIPSTDSIEITAIIEVFEKIYGEENVYARGTHVENGIAKQPIGFQNGMLGAENRIKNLLGIPTFQDKPEILVVSLENFIAEIGNEWYDFYAIVLYDKKHDLKVKGFSQGMAIQNDLAEKVTSLTAPDYPFSQYGGSITISNLMTITNPQVTDSDWYSHVTGGRINKSLALQAAIGAVCGKYWAILKEQNQAVQS